MIEKPVRYFNTNPWGAHVGDCSIRAIVAAIGMRYELICRELGVSWKRGQGLIRDTGISLELIKTTFDDYFDIVQDFNEELPQELMDDPEFARAQFLDAAMGIEETSAGITLAEFLDLYRGQGKFLVGLVANPRAKNPTARKEGAGHIVCAKCFRGKDPFAIDTWDSSEMLVDSFMRVKRSIPQDDPRYQAYDFEKRCFIGY